MSGKQGSDITPENIEIDFFRAEDAPGIARLFQEVYGQTYPIKTYYQPEQLIAENAASRIISSVARTPDGEVVGHNALILTDPATHLYENAAGAVLPSCQGKGIFPLLFKHTIVNTSKRVPVEGIIGEPVCSHTRMQKMCLQIDFRESGLEADLMPSSAYESDQAASGRVSVLLGYFMLERRTQKVYVPAAYRDELEFLYADLNLERTFMLSDEDKPAEKDSRGHLRVFEFAQVARITIDCIGPDFKTYITGMEKETSAKSAGLFQVWLPLASPFISSATDILRGRGYFLGGILPCGRNGDSLMLQKISWRPHWEDIQLYSDRSREIYKFIQSDWARTQNNSES